MRRSVFPTSVILAVTCALAALAPACGAPSPVSRGDGQTAQVASPVIKGTNSDASQDAVVQIIQTVGKDTYTCSGVLIAPNVVLTARHCVSEMNDSPNGIGCGADGVTNTGDTFTTDSKAADIAVVPGATPSDADYANAVVGKKIFHSDDTSICRFDIAIVILQSAIPNAKIAPMRLDGPPVAGETITAVGWGVTDKTDSPTTRQQRKAIPILRVGPAAATKTPKQDPLPPNFFEVGESICEGDSGGPALATATGAVIGLVSIGGNDVTDPNAPIATTCEGTSARNSYFELSKAKELILQALGEAGASPWIEGTPGPSTTTVDAGAGLPDAGTAADGGAGSTTSGATASGATASASTGCSTSPNRAPASPFAALAPLGLVALLVGRARARRARRGERSATSA